MENAISFAKPWLASARPATAGALAELTRETAVAHASEVSRVSAYGSAIVAPRPLTQAPVVNRRLIVDGPQTAQKMTFRSTTNGGARGPHHAWREPVTT